MHGTTGVTLVLAVALIIFLRLRRAVTRQLASTPRLLFRTLILFGLLALVAAGAPFSPPLLVAGLVGLVLGVGIGILGIRLTAFEDGPGAVYYRPNLYLGLGVLALFLLRLVWRVEMVAQIVQSPGPLEPANGAAFGQYASDPVTLLLFVIYIGYYITFNTGVLLHLRRRPGRGAA